MFLNLFILSFVGGCVMNIFIKPPPLKGECINICAVVSVVDVGLSGLWAISVSSFSRADAKPKPECTNFAPASSAKNSLLLDIANLMIVAKIGVRIAKTNNSNPPPPLLSLPP